MTGVRRWSARAIRRAWVGAVRGSPALIAGDGPLPERRIHVTSTHDMPSPAIRITSLRKSYGRHLAVDDVSLDVEPGEIFGLVGPNGAGKTTTMECVEGIRVPDGGTIAVLGLDPVRDVYALQERIGVQLQQAQLQKRIKVWEAVDLWASLYRKKTVDANRLLD